MFNVYDEVWVLEGNKLTKKMVYSVTESMAICSNDTIKRYTLVNGRLGAGVGWNKEVPWCSDGMFDSKEELISSLRD